MKRSFYHRPLLLGVHNPLSDHPKRALWPDPPGCSGHRLWQISEIPLKEWKRAFHRRNLLDARIWDEDEAVENRPSVLKAMEIAPVTIVLGHQVRKFLLLPEVPWILPQKDRRRRFWWRLIPHPSGRTQTYNDPVFRAAVRLMLQEVARK